MMNKKLRSLRESRKLSLEAVAHDVGISTSQLSRYETGIKDPHLGELRKIANCLGVSLSVLIDESSPEMDYIRTIKTVPVRGLVCAGLWFEFSDLQHQSFDPVPAVPTKHAEMEQFAFRMVGPSMDKKRIFDGDYLVCVPYWTVKPQMEGSDLVIVERTEGGKTERTCKETVTGQNGVELWPRSSDERFRQPIIVPYGSEHPTIKIIGLVIGVYSPR